MKKAKKTRSSKPKKIGLRFPSLERNLDNLKLFLSAPEIKQVISETRKFLGLPTEGYSDTDKVMEWNNSMHHRSSEILKSEVFRKQLASIRQKFNNEEISSTMADSQSKLLYDKLPENYLSTTVDYIIYLGDLPVNYSESVRDYIVTDIVYAPPQIFSEGTYYSDEPNRSKIVRMTFYAKLTDADLKDIKKYVNQIAGRNLPDFQPLTKIDQRIRTEEMYENRRKYDEIKGTTYRMTAKEIAENIKQDVESDISEKDVYEHVREIKNLRKKRFKNLGNGA